MSNLARKSDPNDVRLICGQPDDGDGDDDDEREDNRAGSRSRIKEKDRY